MQPANVNHEDEVDLDELGYDIIGTDGESQAESTTSSTDYQGADDVQSLLGTDTGTDVDTNDVDTDSSDEEEVTLVNDSHASIHSIRSTIASTDDGALREEEDASVNTLADQSLENPTSFEQYGLPNIHSSSITSPPDLNRLVGRPQNDDSERLEEESDAEDDVDISPRYPRLNRLLGLPRDSDVADHFRRAIPVLLRNLLVILGVVLISSFLSDPPAPDLSTVPVAAVSSVTTPPVSDSSPTTTSSSTLVVVTAKTPNALQTSSSSDSFALKYLGGKETKESTDVLLASEEPICSVKLLEHNGILIIVPKALKTYWLTQRAIMIAVSRGNYDIPTKLSSVETGFLIQVPAEEAHGILDVYVATTKIPKVNEVFQINFSRPVFSGAFDTVKGFALRVVDTVNVTSAWVEKNYSPAFDTMAKHIREGATARALPALRTFAQEVDDVLTFPARMLSQAFVKLHPSLNSDVVAQRVNQAHLELTRQAQDIRDDLSLRLLTAQLTSKLWWLRVQGKEDEYQQYMANATAYYNQKQADALDARRERAARVKEEIQKSQAQRKGKPEGSRSFSWMMPDWVF